MTVGSLRADVAAVALPGFGDTATLHAGGTFRRPLFGLLLSTAAARRIECVVGHTRSDQRVRIERSGFEARADEACAALAFGGRLSRRLPLRNLHDSPFGVALQNSGHRRAPFSWRGDAPWVRERIRRGRTLDYESERALLRGCVC